ncbi:MAG: translocation/assembly module TamB domain-containing protein, partial [Bradymonadaceae bacterium]
RGTVAGEGQLRGSVGRPRATLTIEIPSGRVLGVPVANLRLEGGLDRRRLRLEQFETNLFEEASVRAHGAIDFAEGAYDASVDLSGLRIQRVVSRLRLPGDEPLPIPAGAEPVGTIDADLDGKGTLRRPAISGDLEIRGLELWGVELGDAALVGYTADGRLHVSGAALPLAALQASIPLDGEHDRYRAKVAFDRLDLASVPGLLESVDIVERLVVSGDVTVTAPTDLSDYKAVANVSDLRLVTEDGSFRNRGPLIVSVDRAGLLHVERAVVGTEDSFVEVRGAVMLGSMLTDLRVQGEVALGLIDVAGEYVLPDTWSQTVAQTRGRIRVDLSISGPPSRPVPRGSVEIQRAEVALRDLDRPVRVESGRIEFGPDAIEVAEENPLVGSVLGGYTQLTGRVEIDDHRFAGGRLSLWGHGMDYRIPGTADVSFDPDVEVRMTDVFEPDTWLVEGTVDILTARYYRNFSIFEEQLTGRVVGAFRRRTEEFEAGLLETNPWLGDVEFDLAIRAADGVRIENRIDRFVLDLQLRLDLRLRERLADPRLTGEIEVVDGTVEFQGETFEVRNGTFEYTGSPDNPLVAVTAGADIRNRCAQLEPRDRLGSELDVLGDFDQQRREVYHVVLRAEGRVDNLDVQFESNPFADQRDVLSLMLTGCTVDSLTASNATSPTLEVALGPLLGQIERQVREVVELSEFTITPGVERTRVVIGDRLSRRLYWNLELDTGFAQEAAEQEYRLEYRLNDFWTAELSERTRGVNRDLLLDLELEYRLPLD